MYLLHAAALRETSFSRPKPRRQWHQRGIQEANEGRLNRVESWSIRKRSKNGNAMADVDGRDKDSGLPAVTRA